ncbi:sporulation protein, partial [Staphylococcus haemolyticus]|uniref:sporulation protein n=2 Tax=Staphylococcus TaxID=1279 RepID=UPI0030D2AFA3
MFEKLLTSIGIESLEINTVLKTQQVHSNGVLDGSVVIESGASEQTINQIELTLIERYDNPDKRSQ